MEQKPDHNRDSKDLAKQLDRYADAITAFAVVQTIAFAVGLRSEDTRQNILKTPSYLIPMLCLLALTFYMILILFCHAGENALIGPPDRDIPAHRWTKRVRAFRILVVTLAVGVALVGIFFTWRGGAK
jgi:hypothetical protein